MSFISKIEEHANVIGNDGGHVGTVDKVEDDRIKLTKADDPDGTAAHHHYIPMSSIASVEDGVVKLSVSAEQAKTAAAKTA